MATEHLRSLATLESAEIVALCDVVPEQIEAARKHTNDFLEHAAADAPRRSLDAAAYTDHRRMLRDERLDAVYVCLPPFAHGEPERAVIEAGCALFVEKPVALDLATAAELLHGIEQRGLIAASGYQFRYTDYLRRAKEFLSGHIIGQVVGMRFSGTPGTSWYHRQDRSGGQLTEMVTHQIDMLRYLVGEVSTVYAAGATRINNRERPDYDIFDVNCTTLKFENGAVGSFSNNTVTSFNTHVEPWAIHIFCDDLVLSLGSKVRVSTPDGQEEVELERGMVRKEDEAFVRAVAEGAPELVRSTYESGVRNLAVTLSADESARTGQPVSVAERLASVGL